ncbi:MAG: ferrous iron transport protein A [Firmicutes bacterium]|nr:ferrous iron transport protein A [Bacillota bacterium]
MVLLNELKVGEEAVVKELIASNRRLWDIGLVPGTRVKCVLKSPLGDPVAYKIRGAIIAIRKEEALRVGVEVMDYD